MPPHKLAATATERRCEARAGPNNDMTKRTTRSYAMRDQSSSLPSSSSSRSQRFLSPNDKRPHPCVPASRRTTRRGRGQERRGHKDPS